ncbi:MAG: hypothetical protein EP338_05440 [Bacteroidetes bacterium]|nr:MAG: hypothetical protein EP338_05440 [Bacteroidota bacterium]
MKNLVLFFFAFLLTSLVGRTQENLDFKFADNYCSKIEEKVQEIGSKYGLKVSELIPVVYPECARFNAITNAFESSVLEHFYIEEGCRGADFSVGYFQMKPSFIEQLDQVIQEHPLFAKRKAFFAYQASGTKNIRNERLNRLFSEDWQIEYLCCFVQLMKLRHQKEGIQTSELAFISSAYNYGFHKSTSKILAWEKIRAFPNGRKHQSNNFTYAELALLCKSKFYAHEN